MSSADPSIDCDCRAKSIRNVRIGSVVVFLCALVVSTRDPWGAAGASACAAVAWLAFAVYGIATMFDETATFPKWLYAGFGLLGASLAAYHGLALI